MAKPKIQGPGPEKHTLHGNPGAPEAADHPRQQDLAAITQTVLDKTLRFELYKLYADEPTQQDLMEQILQDAVALARPKQLTIGGPTSDPLRVHKTVNKTVTFEELVPIRPREHGRRIRGQWVWSDALDLCIAAEAWKQTGWQQDGAREHQAAISKLWACFNRMFPPETAADAEAWRRVQQGDWQPPRVTHSAQTHSAQTHSAHGAHRATYDLTSISDGAPCVFQFRFERDLKHVLVIYEGPVRFDLGVVEAARGDAGPPEETWEYSHLVR
jgi:hypothetical protein